MADLQREKRLAGYAKIVMNRALMDLPSSGAIDEYLEGVPYLLAELNEARAEATRLKAALRRYGEHEFHCPIGGLPPEVREQVLKTSERVWEVLLLAEYLEGEDSDYGEPALSERKALQAWRAALDALKER